VTCPPGSWASQTPACRWRELDLAVRDPRDDALGVGPQGTHDDAAGVRVHAEQAVRVVVAAAGEALEQLLRRALRARPACSGRRRRGGDADGGQLGRVALGLHARPAPRRWPRRPASSATVGGSAPRPRRFSTPAGRAPSRPGVGPGQRRVGTCADGGVGRGDHRRGGPGRSGRFFAARLRGAGAALPPWPPSWAAPSPRSWRPWRPFATGPRPSAAPRRSGRRRPGPATTGAGRLRGHRRVGGGGVRRCRDDGDGLRAR
jgi:hypothetical protein